MILNTKYGEIKIFTNNVESEAISQITELGNSSLGENAHIRIMPDVHAGKGCTIGTTMKITDKVCPNIVGVDIGCGVALVRTCVDFKENLEKLDEAIRKVVPYGQNSHQNEKPYEDFKNMKCWDKLPKKVQELSQKSLGTLGGGNHFIEAYENGYLAVHSGSRNIGLNVAKYYQTLAEQIKVEVDLSNIPPQERAEYLKAHKPEKISKHLKYLTGENLDNYLHDIEILQIFAVHNRQAMLKNIVKELDPFPILTEMTESIHNYIDLETMILRKGAISAREGELLVIPLNMRDGLLLCKGKGNEDWNFSAPHGAGRLYSRRKAKEEIKLEDFQKSMEGIYTTCVSEKTLDESPFAYKDYKEIMENVEPTVEIIERLIPIYNFKAD